MGRQSPGRIRRKGREAFIPGADPMDHCPYHPLKFGYEYHSSNWLEGWNEAKRAYEEEQEREPTLEERVEELERKVAELRDPT